MSTLANAGTGVKPPVFLMNQKLDVGHLKST